MELGTYHVAASFDRFPYLRVTYSTWRVWDARHRRCRAMAGLTIAGIRRVAPRFEIGL